MRKRPRLSGGAVMHADIGACFGVQLAFGLAAFFASLMHLERNFLRSLPLRPFASASAEHLSDSAERGAAGAFVFAAGLAAG